MHLELKSDEIVVQFLYARLLLRFKWAVAVSAFSEMHLELRSAEIIFWKRRSAEIMVQFLYAMLFLSFNFQVGCSSFNIFINAFGTESAEVLVQFRGCFSVLSRMKQFQHFHKCIWN
jgi:hypothetical protein